MKCHGCGVEIQTVDPQKPGFLPEHVFEKFLSNEEEALCQRCFKLKHYGELMPMKIDINFLSELKKIIKNFDTVLWVIDIIDFEGTYDKQILELVKDKNVFLIINKVDLLPKSVAFAELKDWVLERVKNDLNIKKDNIRLISAKKNFGINRLMKILKGQNINKAIVVGTTNVGKSSLLNTITNVKITTSSFPGTTLGVVRRKIPDYGIELYDTPGIETNNRFTDFFDIYTQVEMIPKRTISRKTFKPDVGKVIFISSLFRFKILSPAHDDLKPIFLIFAPENISFHQTKEERVEDLLQNRIGEVLYPPYEKNYPLDIEYEKEIVMIEENEELALPGLGWISVRRGPLNIEVVKPKNIEMVIRKPLISPKKGNII
ncbi:GTP-binding protein [Marinitoga sp. 1135]|uniref:Ribosome biogenesis GTPase YqeH n=1 Tax=Marinitoga piezophila (strain DSM 14283 / JCM 11233 / KA3) TaxID=443254 RepID=H2J4E7_MARPK|nr:MULTISPECIES: ribosome biogenesis GTPase YqeH [Marinitoga]AEX84802.1 ribosome biogenesis GTPase YqeH [Marinitoga piezophila KA3]NUU95046.1 GTP-binding protein [Marinitoga sp. 1135]